MIKHITFNEVIPIWSSYLWKDRRTDIKPTNGLKFLGGFDKSIEDNISTFFGAFDDWKCIGVNSGHATSDTEYRSRGIYVMPEYRGRGVAQELFKAVEQQAISEKKITLWSMPRQSALSSYQKFGFDIVSPFFNDMEFGPNCYVVKLLQ